MSKKKIVSTRSITLTVLVILISFLTININYSQNNTSGAIKRMFEQNNDGYLREDIYLHLPKLVYWQNETIWFSGYVINSDSKKPSVETANVYCGIYDAVGKEIIKEIFYVENGVFHGQLKIPQDKGSGKYFVKAYTSWMLNFPDVQPFLQDIYIVNKDAKSLPQNNGPNEILLFPEGGGSLINNVDNTIGVQLSLTDDLVGTSFSCDVLNQEGTIVVKNISVNGSGTGKFKLRPLKNKRYRLRLTSDSGETLYKVLPESIDFGYAISINNLLKDKIIIGINTNAETINYQESQDYYLAIHNGKLHEVVNLKVLDTINTFTLSREDLLQGVNHLTFFNSELLPIARRVMLNSLTEIDRFTPIKEDIIAVKNDSLQLRITLPSSSATSENTVLSVAVLPYNSISADKHINLKQWFKFKDVFQNNSINDLNYYADNLRQYSYKADLYLLNTKSHKNRRSKVFEDELRYEFENGFNIAGRIKKKSSYGSKQAIAYQKSAGSFLTTNIEFDNRFSFKNVYLQSDEVLGLSITNKDNLSLEDLELYISPMIKSDSLTDEELSLQTQFFSKQNEEEFRQINDTIPPSYFSGSNQLSEVLIKAKKETDMERNIGLTYGVYETKKIGEEERKRYPMLSTYVRRLGFRVFQNFQNSAFVILAKSLQDYPPVVYLDGIRTSIGLNDTSMDNIDEIYYEHFGVEGSNGGTIYIYRRVDYSDDKRAIVNVNLDSGYTASKPFIYESFKDYSFKDLLTYGLFYWNGNTKLDKEGYLLIKFPMFNSKKFIVQVNGITSSGELISINKIIDSNDY